MKVAPCGAAFVWRVTKPRASGARLRSGQVRDRNVEVEWREVTTDRARIGFVIALAVLAAGGVLASTSAAGDRATRPQPQSEAGCSEETAARFIPVIRWHAERYPHLQVEDLYKLLHQSVAGPAHAIDDPEMARQWLMREWSALGNPFETEETYEPLSSDGRLVRVNLRPWRTAGHAPEAVLNAFVRTAGTLPPDTAHIRTELDAILACSELLADGLPLSGPVIQSFFNDRARDRYPAIHHSEEYSRTYRPAYRVVLRGYLD